VSRTRFLLGALLAVLFVQMSAPAYASRPLDQRRFSFDPAMGYILVRVGPTGDSGRLRSGPLYLVQVDRAKGEVASRNAPLAMDRRDVFDAAVVRGGDHWGTDGQTSLYLLPAAPGFWAIGASGNTAFSLGSWGFEVRPGEITWVGTILIGRQDGNSPIPEIAAARLSPDLVSFGTLMNIVMSDAVLVRPAAVGEALPAALTAHPVRHAELVPDVRFENFLFGLVNRALGLPPMGHAPLVPEEFNPFTFEPPADSEAGPESGGGKPAAPADDTPQR
jgi:hypothetical protein